MGQLIKKTLIIKDIKNKRQVFGIAKIHKNSIFKLYFDFKSTSLSENLTAAVISSNMPIQFVQFKTKEFDIDLSKETNLEGIVIIIISTKSGLPLASSDCEDFLLIGYLDTIKNLRKQFLEKFSFNNKFNSTEPVKEIPKKEPLTQSLQALKEILEQPKIYLNNANNNEDIIDFKTQSEDLKESKTEKIQIDNSYFEPAEQPATEERFECVIDEMDLKTESKFTTDDINIYRFSNEPPSIDIYVDDDVLLREDSTLGDDLKIADENYYDYDKVLNSEKPVKPFYESIKGELEELFNKHEHEVVLEKIISQSKFCKIMYEENKYYIVGLILEDNVPQFICYGVPTFNADIPPKELGGFSSYIPTNPDNLNELGYWVMYQDAGTGETIYPKEE